MKALLKKNYCHEKDTPVAQNKVRNLGHEYKAKIFTLVKSPVKLTVSPLAAVQHHYQTTCVAMST